MGGGGGRGHLRRVHLLDDPIFPVHETSPTGRATNNNAQRHGAPALTLQCEFPAWMAWMASGRYLPAWPLDVRRGRALAGRLFPSRPGTAAQPPPLPATSKSCSNNTHCCSATRLFSQGVGGGGGTVSSTCAGGLRSSLHPTTLQTCKNTEHTHSNLCPTSVMSARTACHSVSASRWWNSAK